MSKRNIKEDMLFLNKKKKRERERERERERKKICLLYINYYCKIQFSIIFLTLFGVWDFNIPQLYHREDDADENDNIY